VKVIAAVLATALAVLIGALGVELWTRAHWNPRKGVPGFFLSDPVRIQRLSPGFTGWFAGVPVRINRLELRDDRDYALEKSPNTVRILVLGDSVTFGHGSVAEHAYPFLLEQKLRAWRPDVDWQVWNAAVPGYNTSQELAQLLEVGPRFKPDLVVVGFFENDFVDNYPVRPATRVARLRSAALSWMYRHVYSIELYKRLYLQLAWRMSGSNNYHLRLEHVAEEEQLTATADEVADLAAQKLTPFDELPEQPDSSVCPGAAPASDLAAAVQSERGWPYWLEAVQRFHDLHRQGTYRIVFFANVVPVSCAATDRFVDGGSSALNRFYMHYLGDGTPAVSVYDAFRRLRPSQMPFAEGHALGNANVVKAEVLFRYLRDAVLPALVRPR